MLDWAVGIRREISADTRRKGRILFTCTFSYILYLSTCFQRPPSSLKGFSPATLTNSASASSSKSVFVVGAASVCTRRADNTIRAERFSISGTTKWLHGRGQRVSIHHRFAFYNKNPTKLLRTEENKTSVFARSALKVFFFSSLTQISVQRNSSMAAFKRKLLSIVKWGQVDGVFPLEISAANIQRRCLEAVKRCSIHPPSSESSLVHLIVVFCCFEPLFYAATGQQRDNRCRVTCRAANVGKHDVFKQEIV